MDKRFIVQLLGKNFIGALKWPTIYLKLFLHRFDKSRQTGSKVLIFGLGRSGTTWVSNEISKSYDLYDYGEVFQFPSRLIFSKFLNYLIVPKKSIVKLLTYQIIQNRISTTELVNWINKNFDYVVIVQRNFLDQILSSLYSEQTKIYHNEMRDNLLSITLKKEDFKAREYWCHRNIQLRDDVISKITVKIREIDYDQVAKDYFPEVLDEKKVLGKRKPKKIAKRISIRSVRDRIKNLDDVLGWVSDEE